MFASDGRTDVLAFDHGYFQVPTSSLERVDLNILPLAPPYVDALMAMRAKLNPVLEIVPPPQPYPPAQSNVSTMLYTPQ